MGNLEQEMVIQRELESAASRQRAADEEEIHQLRKKLEEVRYLLALFKQCCTLLWYHGWSMIDQTNGYIMNLHQATMLQSLYTNVQEHISYSFAPTYSVHRGSLLIPSYFLSRTQAQGKNLEFESEMNSIKDKVSMKDPQCTRMMGGFVIHATFPLV